MVRSRSGVTLIELLTVVVILTIAAATVLPRLAQTKDETYVAAMKYALRDIGTREESYALHHRGGYFSGNGSPQGLTPPQNVTITATTTTSPNSWSATARHALTPKICTIVASGMIKCR